MILKYNIGSGASGRFEAIREYAEEYAFLLDMEGITS